MIKRTILFLVSICYFILFANATHIVGGSLSLKWVSGNTYILKLKVLRDCVNGQIGFDGTGGFGGGGGGVPKCIVGFYDLANNKNMQYIDMGAPVITKLQIEGPGCATEPNVCTELGVYTKTMTFNPATYNSTVGYYFSYQRCCRNNIIQNINKPEDAAIAVYMEVPPFALRNSTPEFTNNPFTFLCANNPFNYNFDFIEPDGDSIHYSMITPLNGFLSSNSPSSTTPLPGPYPTINWLPNYSDAAEVRGNPPLNINASTGEVTMTPIESGTFVAAFRVEEFRFGKKLGEVRLELQFTITNCLGNPFPQIFYKNLNGTFNSGNFSVKIPDQLCFNINVKDPFDSLYIKLSSPLFKDTTLTSKPTLTAGLNFTAFKDTTVQFCWQTDCSLTGKADQIVNIETTDNGCPLPKTTKSFFTIHIDSMPHVKPVISFRDQNGNIFKDSNDQHFNTTVSIPNSTCFDILVDDDADSMRVDIEGNAFTNPNYKEKPVLNTDFSYQAKLHAESQFCWQTGCSLTNHPDHIFSVKVTDGGCYPRTDSIPFFVHVLPMPLVSPPDLLCMTLVSDNETIIEYGDSTLNDPFYYNFHIYRAVQHEPYRLMDSITSRQVKSLIIDRNSPGNHVLNYQYYLRAVNKCGVEGPPSDTVETAASVKPTPDMQKILTVTVEDNSKIKIIWPQTWEKDFARYFLYKSLNGGSSYVQIADFNKIWDTVFVDELVDVQANSYCYYLVMKDTCQNYGPIGKQSCSILLTGSVTPFQNHINWTPYTYWDNGTKSYSLYKSDLLSPVFNYWLDNDITKLNQLDDNLNRKSGKFYYYVIANQSDPPIGSGTGSSDPLNLLNSRSNDLELIQAPIVYVPNAFTPNSDGTNDDWDVRDEFVKDFEIRVYDRWGQCVFNTTDKNIHWRGELPGNKIAPDGVYVYMVMYTGWDESLYYTKGNVTILR